MSSLALLLLLLLLLCISLHACTSGPLSLTQKQTAKCHFHKDLDKVKIMETFIAASKSMPYTSEDNQVQQQKVANEEISICERGGSASSLKQVEIVRTTLGIEVSTSSQTDSPSSFSTKGQRRHGRSMLGPAQHHVEDTMEGMVEMDYAQPHRKPPIHNEKP